MNVNRTLCADATLPAPLRGGSMLSALGAAALRGYCTIQLWSGRAQQRAALATLSDRMLKDIGISRASANLEAAKPFWRA